MFSPFVVSRNRPTINYSTGFFQVGYMLSESIGDHKFRGNLQLVGEGFGSGIFAGRGDYLAGATCWLRYNFVETDWLAAPYFQVGGGFLLTDIDRSVVGQAFNFNLGTAVGFRRFDSPRCSVNLEYRFSHISNAKLGPHNLGINAHGPVLGLSWFF